MILDIVFLILGLALILLGANALTDGASAMARRWGVSDLVVGLTVVAFGTSTPELVISIMSAVEGSAELAIGNVVGSNILNILLIIGLTALIRPLKVEKSMLSNDIPLVFLSALAILIIGNGPLLGTGQPAEISRVDGLLLLLFFAIFMRYTFSQASDGDAASEEPKAKSMPMWKAILWVVGGLAALIYGGDRFVAGASGLARSMGVSEAIIGLTIVALGTSLPELATSVAAALKGQNGMAIGNVIGSNIFNAFLVLGCSATVRPLPFGSIGNYDLITMTAASLFFWFVGRYYRHYTITRIEGALMIGCYIAYTAVRLFL